MAYEMMGYGYTDEGRKRARMNGLLTAGLALLGARRGQELQALGRAGLLGVGAYNQDMRDTAEERRLNIGSRRQEQLMAMQEAQMAEQARIAQGMEAARVGATTNIPAYGPPTASGEMQAPVQQFDLNRYAQGVMAVDPMKGIALAQALGKQGKELKDTRTLMHNGQRVTVNFYKDGTHEILPYAPDAEKLHFANVGNAIIPADPFTGKPAGGALPIGQSPDSAASVGATLRGQNMTDARAREFNSITQGKAVNEKAADLRKEFNALPQVKAYGVVQPVLQSVREAMSDDTAAADLNLIYGAAKIFDPESVVRESETTMVVKTGSPAERFLGQFNYVAGGGRLTKEARNQLVKQIESRVRGHESSYKAARQAYEGIADKQGVAKDQVFVEPFVPSMAAQPKLTPMATATTTAKVMVERVLREGDPKKIEELRRMGYIQ